MKNLLLFLFLFPSILFAQKTQTEYYYQKLKSAEGKVDDKNHRTGEWKFWDHKGNLVAIRQYKDDMLDGICVYEKYDWEPTEPQLSLMISNKSLYDKAIQRQKVSKLDTIIEKTEYHKNQLHGIKYVYDANGNPVSEISYFENKKNGVQKNYNYKTGILTEMQYHNNDQLDSLFRFDKDGHLIMRIHNSNDFTRRIEYDNGFMVRKEEIWHKQGSRTSTTCTYEKNILIDCDTMTISWYVPPLNTNSMSSEVHLDIPPLDAIKIIEEDIYEFPEKEAKYPGGPEAMMTFLISNYKLPTTDIEPTHTKIYIRFVVEKDGSLSNLEILRGAGEPYDREAKRVIRAMPKWEPAEDRGKVVRSYMVIPFTLEIK